MTYRRFMRFISILLAVVMTMQVIPANAVAAITAENTSEALDIKDSKEAEEAISIGNKSFKILGEVESLRDENNKHFRLEDGSYIAVSYNGPVHYRDASGKWKEINNKLTLTQGLDGRKVYQSNNAVTPTTFSTDLEDGALLTTSVDDVSVTMRILDSTQAERATVRSSGSLASLAAEAPVQFNRSAKACVIEGATDSLALKVDPDEGAYENAEALQLENYETSVLYPEAYPDTDLQYTAYGYHIKEQIIVKKPQNAYRYDFMLELDGLSAILNEDGSVSLTDDENIEKYYIPAPYMEDANGVYSTDAVYTLSEVEGGAKLTVIADEKWLNAKDRAFPVAIDPTLQMVISQKTENDSSLYSTYVKEGSPDTTLFGCRDLYFGYSSLSDVKKQYGYLHFNQMPTVPSGSIVTMAKLHMFMCSYSQINCTEMPLNVYEVTDAKPSTASNYYDWFSRISWNNKPAFNTVNAIDYAMTSASVDDTYLSWEITELVKKWYDEDTENRTIAIVPSNNAAFSSSYCASATFYAYHPSYGPNLIVHYRSSVGLEPYYTYNTIGAGNAGTAYIANESGQLKVAVPLAGYSSTINPVSVNLIYNSDYFTSSTAYKPPLSLGLDMAVGHGWTLDIIQKMEDITLSGIEYKKYTDGDGTVHYFLPKEGDSTYFYDEDGLGLKVKENGSNHYVMSDDHGNTWTFTNHFLTNISDENGNQILINYSNGRITTVQQKNNGNGAITVASFAYSSVTNALTTITDAAANVYELVYSNTTGNLIDIEKNNTVIARYCYDGRRITRAVDMESSRAVAFTYSNKKISSYYEVIGVTVNDITGAHVKVNYTNCSKTIYHDYGNDRVYDSEDDILTHYLFDYAGRTVNAYTTDVTGKILGAENAVYTGIGDVNKKNNRTEHYSSIGVAAQHLMKNTGMEDTAAYLWTLESTSVATTKPRTGLRSIKGTLGSSTQSALRSVGTISANVSYTFSAYVNTADVTNFSNTGIYLRVRDQSTNKIWDSLPINYRTSNEVDDGWVRISVSFTAETGGDHIVGIYCDGGSGTFYADDFQLEQGVSVSNYNLIENGGMELSNYGWTYESSASSCTGLGAADSEHSIEIAGNPLDTTTTHAYQEVKVNLPSSETYVLSGWVGAKSVAGDERKKCGLKAVVYYSDGTTEEHYAPFHSDISTWQFLSYSIVPKEAGKTVSKIRVVCVYEGNANRAYFDNISLVREAVQTMKYDDDGNLQSVLTPGLNEEVNTYEGGNLIQSVTGGCGTYEYEYNTTYKHRLNSIKGYYLTQTMGYSDGKGNVTSTTLSDNREIITATLKSGAGYSQSGNLQTSYTDENVVTTTYSYSDDYSIVYGIPNITTTENGTQTVREIDADGRITKVYIPSTASASYTYSDGDLTQITRTDTVSGKATNYTLSYDSFGNLTTAKAGNNVLATYTYGDKNGLLEAMRYGNDPDSDPSIDYEYDRLGRLDTKEYDSGHLLSYSYSGDGQLARIKESLSGSANFLYFSLDRLGRLETIRRQNGTATVLHASTTYNANNQITGQSWKVGRGTDAKTYTESYTYNSADGLLTGVTTATNEVLSLNRDGLRRLSSITGGMYTKRYTYRNESETRTTNQLETLSYPDLATPLTYRYTYNSVGYISAITDPIAGNREYAYDSQGQMLRETINGTAYTYTYDKVGNILTANNHSGSHTYVYNHGSWRDQLTKYDGVEILYDAIGNPTNYYNGRNFTFTWQNGRELKTAVSDDHTTTYEYDHINGTRLSKTVDGVKYEYYYSGDQLLRMTIGSGKIVDFFYDQSGQPYAMKYNNKVYYYILNAQGDVVKLISQTGESYGIYNYDAWGNLLYVTDNDVMAVNPLRYRGYVYDTETKLYYCNSRYYDPAIGRWLNVDNQIAGVGGEILGYNMFAYCMNNPVNMSDPSGNWPRWATITLGAVAAVVAVAVTVVTLGAAAPAAACTLTAVGMSIGASYAVASTAATVAVVATTVAAAAYAGDIAYSAVTGDSLLLDTVFQGNTDAYNTGVAITSIATAGMLEMATQSPGVCFVAGTPVLTACGYIAIEEIKAGDMVWAENPETGEKELKEVVQTFVNKTTKLIYVQVDREEIVTTPEHPFYSPVKGWIAACKLRTGDILVLQNGKYVTVKKVQHEILEAPITVYNFEVADFHTYYVGKSSVLVHNTCGGKPTSPNQMQKQVERGQAPSTVVRVDNPKIPGQLPHIHFSDGTAMNIDGSVHDAMRGAHTLTNSERIWIFDNGWGG